MLEIDGVQHCQSVALLRYLANTHGKGRPLVKVILKYCGMPGPPHVCVLVVKSVCLGLRCLVGPPKVLGTGVCLWALEVVFAGDPTSLARNNTVNHCTELQGGGCKPIWGMGHFFWDIGMLPL